ncbi:hypothetical protein K8O92_24595 [Nocardia asteroides]|nr:hypothetical protein K8O92_24595 [Nocardia asteroides]
MINRIGASVTAPNSSLQMFTSGISDHVFPAGVPASSKYFMARLGLAGSQGQLVRRDNSLPAAIHFVSPGPDHRGAVGCPAEALPGSAPAVPGPSILGGGGTPRRHGASHETLLIVSNRVGAVLLSHVGRAFREPVETLACGEAEAEFEHLPPQS